MEIPIKMDDLGVPLFSETPISKFVGMNVKKPFNFFQKSSRQQISFVLPPPPKV